MVALNFQTSDLSMQLNQGKFEYNGNCGCVASFLIYRLLQVSLSVTECTIIVCLVSVCRSASDVCKRDFCQRALSVYNVIVLEHHESRGNFVMKASHHARCVKGTLMVHKKHDGTLGNGAVIYF